MEESFLVNQSLLQKARQAFYGQERLYWIMGASCTGKSTVAKAVAGRSGLQLVDMDSYIYDRFMPAYRLDRHPSSKAWFGAANPLAWVLSLTWEEFDDLNRATNAEFLDLLADEAASLDGERGLLVDGGFTHPSVLAQVVSPSKIVCLETSDEIRSTVWETAEDRASMKGWVQDLPDGQAMWRKFLYFDKMMAQTMGDESRAAGVKTISRGEGMSVDELAEEVVAALGVDGEA